MKRNFLLANMLFVLVLNVLAQTNIPYGNNASAGNYVKVNGINLYYETYGEGQPMLFLHGNGGSIAGRAAMISQFSKKYKVIAVDSRCHGKSECMAGDLNYEMMAADIHELLNYLKIDSAMIWGHSDGAIIGLIMSYTYPSKVKKLLASGANLVPDKSALQPELVDMMGMYKVIPDTLMKKQMKLMVDNPHITTEQLKKIKAPVLVMAGDRDAIRNEHTLQIFSAISNSQLSILPGTTHFIAEEQFSLFLQIASTFFSKPFAMPSTVEIMKKVAQQMMGQ